MSSRLTRDDARALALEILRGKPDPVVRVRLLRDVLRAEEGDVRLHEARAALENSAHVTRLRDEQKTDGSWGRLHSRDTTREQHVPTTEWGVERAVALGLDAGHPVVSRAASYLRAILEGRAEPLDPPERNDRWAAGLRLFVGATLSLVAPYDRVLDSTWELWHEIARRSFPGGAYDADAEAEAHRSLSGASVRGTYLVLSNHYALALLAARPEALEPELRHALAAWFAHREEGVGSYGVPLSLPPVEATPAGLERFLLSHEAVARLGVPAVPTGPLADWLETLRRPDGLWDLGPRATWTPSLPLSESWRRRDARATDWTVRVLALLIQWLA